MKNLLTILILLLFAQSGFGQQNTQNDSVRNETHIFWSDTYIIQIEDFKDTITTIKSRGYCEKYNLCWGAFTGLFSIMDIPQKKRDKKVKEEIIYIAPAFEVNQSYRLTSDSMDYLKQVIVFDMYELAARKCRIELDSIYQKIPAIGTKGLVFKSIESKIQEELGNMVLLYTQEVYIMKEEGAFEKWRKLIDELLNQTEYYKTTAQDRLRFIKKEPIEIGYIEAKTVIGNLFKE